MPLLVTSASGANGNGSGALLAFGLDGTPRGNFIDDDRIAAPRGLAVDPKVGRQARVPLFGNMGLCQQLGSKEYGRERDFRQKLAKWLREVKVWWPECPAIVSTDSRFLLLSSAKGSPAINSGRQV